MERIDMRKIMEVFRLHFEEGLSDRKIAASLSIGRGTVSNYPVRLDSAGLTCPLPGELTGSNLEMVLFPERVHDSFEPD